MSKQKLPPVHPGELLSEGVADLEISMNELAQEIHVPANRIRAIAAGKRSGETALRLARYFGATPEYGMNLQTRYDLETAAGSGRQLSVLILALPQIVWAISCYWPSHDTVLRSAPHVMLCADRRGSAPEERIAERLGHASIQFTMDL
jgi:antitoxin HigA-1